MTKVITYGTYDLLHYGHIRLLERAKALGDYLIVGVTSDDYDKVRGKINNQQSLMERIEAVRATGLADEVIVEEYDGQKIDDIKRYGVDIFTLGSDWEGKFDYLAEYCKVVYLPRTEGISSSDIRAEKRRVTIAVLGELGLRDTFISEATYVNGIELTEDYDSADAVYIVSQPESHYADVKKALQDGKHVLCNPPFAIKTSECEELMELANAGNLVLFDAVKTAYLTAYQRMLLLVKSGKIGDVLSVDATCTSLRSELNPLKAQNSLCGWGPTAMLPIFQLLGTGYKSVAITSRLLDEERMFDAFTKLDFVYDHAVASIKVAKGAKSEGELIITGSKGYVYVPAPWWKTDYFEIRYEDTSENRRYFYQMDGLGTRYQIGEFARAIQSDRKNHFISADISKKFAELIEMFFGGHITRI